MRLRCLLALIVAAAALVHHATHALPPGIVGATIEPEYSFVHRGRLYETLSANASSTPRASHSDSRIAISLAIDAAVPRRFVLDLTPNDGLFAHTYTTFSPGDGGRGRPIAASERCHYLGDVYEDDSTSDDDAEMLPHGPAAVSICDGILTGLITVDDELYDVSPAAIAPLTRSPAAPGVLAAGNLWRRLAFPIPRAAPAGQVLPAEEVGADGYAVQRLGELERALTEDAMAAAAGGGKAETDGGAEKVGHWCGLHGVHAEKRVTVDSEDDTWYGDDGVSSPTRSMSPAQFFFDNPFQPRPRLRPFVPHHPRQPQPQPQPPPQPNTPRGAAGGSATNDNNNGSPPPSSPTRRPTLNELLGPNAHLRRRPWSPLRVPTSPQFVELHLYHDAARLARFAGDAGAALRSGARVANAVDALYRTNGFSPPIRIVLVGQTVLDTTPNELMAPSNFSPQRQRRETDPNALLRGFLTYSDPGTSTGKQSDARALLTGRYLQGSVVGLAQLGDMCVPAYSGVIAQAVPEAFGEGVLAMIVAHELGHGLGMPHDGDPEEMDTIDGETVSCPGGGHIMSVYTSAAARFDTFSRCSREFVRAWFFIDAKSASMCLANTPAATWSEVVCGNGIVEPGEACDCGPRGSPACARDPCCVPELCILTEGAACSEAEPCCDKCQPIPASSAKECRPARHAACDTREVCDGSSGKCPTDVFAPLGTSCVPPAPGEMETDGRSVVLASSVARRNSTGKTGKPIKDGKCFTGTCQSVRTTCAAYGMHPCPVQPPAEQCRQLLCSPVASPSSVSECRAPQTSLRSSPPGRRANAGLDTNPGDVPVPEGMPCNRGRGQCLSGLCVATGSGLGSGEGSGRGHAVAQLLGIPEPWVWVVIAAVAGVLLVTVACCAAKCCRPQSPAAAAAAGNGGHGFGEPRRAIPMAAVAPHLHPHAYAPQRNNQRPGQSGDGSGVFVGGRQSHGEVRPLEPYTEAGAALNPHPPRPQQEGQQRKNAPGKAQAVRAVAIAGKGKPADEKHAPAAEGKQQKKEAKKATAVPAPAAGVAPIVVVPKPVAQGPPPQAKGKAKGQGQGQGQGQGKGKEQGQGKDVGVANARKAVTGAVGAGVGTAVKAASAPVAAVPVGAVAATTVGDVPSIPSAAAPEEVPTPDISGPANAEAESQQQSASEPKPQLSSAPAAPKTAELSREPPTAAASVPAPAPISAPVPAPALESALTLVPPPLPMRPSQKVDSSLNGAGPVYPSKHDPAPPAASPAHNAARLPTPQALTSPDHAQAVALDITPATAPIADVPANVPAPAPVTAPAPALVPEPAPAPAPVSELAPPPLPLPALTPAFDLGKWCESDPAVPTVPVAPTAPTTASPVMGHPRVA